MKSKAPLKIAGINFSHMHMGDLLRCVHAHPHAEIAGICHQERSEMERSVEAFSIAPEKIFTSHQACLETVKPDAVILCPPTAEHAKWVERVAPYGVHILVEKPFAASLKDADRMILAMKGKRKKFMINWPLRWVASHVKAYELIRAGTIGRLREVHYYDGNRGPLYHTADKIETHPTPAKKSASWWYQRRSGGGSLLDYLGYGVTLGTWFLNGKKPLEVCTMVDEPKGLEVDEHSITICRYANGLSKFETRWGTFTDPWVHQPQPMCGFVLKGEKGTISSYDYAASLRVQTEAHPEGIQVEAPDLKAPYDNAINYFVHCITSGEAIDGPLSPKISRIGQQIVDSAVLSAKRKQTVKLLG